jgi:protein gp37
MWDLGFSYAQQKIVVEFAAVANWHWFINLTKQPQNIPTDFVFPANWIQGVSICRKTDLWRIQALRETKAVLKMISFEPLYEDLGDIDLAGIGWIVIGSQTHPLIAPRSTWVFNLVGKAHDKNIPVFTKNNLSGWSLKEYPTQLQFGKRTGGL